MAKVLVEKLSIEETPEAFAAEVTFNMDGGYECACPSRPLTVSEAQALAKAVSKRRRELEEDDFPY